MVSTSEERWGVWGGKPPGGWCIFFWPDREVRTSKFGTRLEAENLRATHLREIAESCAKYKSTYQSDWIYEVVLFDPDREPIPKDVAPSPAQVRALALLAKLRDRNNGGAPEKYRYHEFWEETQRNVREALYDRGWIMHREDVCPITKAGLRVLEEWG